MKGHIVDFEAKRIYDAGVEFGKRLLQKTIDEQKKTIAKQKKTIANLKKALAKQRKALDEQAEASTIQMALAMLQDKMDFSSIEQYTRLPLARIEELAHELGL
ncbi:MAG: hypothetical protein IJU76_05390 [Desulfovibrionaceae bacterium]|nr:hypothetical protein [Desulfovibrionaceae bacterium]